MRFFRFALFLIILSCFFNIGKCCGESEHRFNVINPLHNSLGIYLEEFRQKNAKIEAGVSAIQNIYDAEGGIEELYNNKKCSKFSRKILLLLHALAAGSCEVFRCLSVFHPDNEIFGKTLTGLYVAKALFWGIDSYLSGSVKQSSTALLSAALADPALSSCISTISNQMANTNIDSLIEISDSIIEFSKDKTFNTENSQKLKRLDHLTKKLKGKKDFKNVVVVGGKLLSFLTGVASGLTVAITGQKSTPSYWMTLVAGGFDSIIDSFNTSITKKPIIQKYITVSEIVYLCDYFIQSQDLWRETA